MEKSKKLRQAVVVVHGMGEQRPLEMLNGFIDAAIPGTTTLDPNTDLPIYYSRPTTNTDMYEGRVYLARETDKYLQTEFYEYHWPHMMQGNKLSNIWETFQRMLFTPIWNVPSGLRVIWLAFWMIIAGVVWTIWTGKLGFADLTNIETLVSMVVSCTAVAGILTWAMTKFLPGKITASFVDVVRYLDTWPRSYAVRRNIRKGMLDFLDSLHKAGHYDRIIVVVQSLGAYVAYDGITYLWTRMKQDHVLPLKDGQKDTRKKKIDPKVLQDYEAEAKALLKYPKRDQTRYRDELQRDLWNAHRDAGNPWLITDFVTADTPMYMAGKLLTKNEKKFRERVKRRDLAVCPPETDLPGVSDTMEFFYPYKGGDVLYHVAPFSIVRWSNMWFPAHLGFFGDWFGGPLRRLFGNGIKDHALVANDWKSKIPAWAHTKYFSYPENEDEGSATEVLHEFMGLNPDGWLRKK